MSRRRCCCGPTCGNCCVPCSPCSIPKADLTCVVNGTTTTILRWNPGSSHWTDGTRTLACTGGNAVLTGGGTWSLSSSVCNPLSLTFTSGGNTAVITGPEYGVTTCCHTFQINGCAGVGLPGATVKVYDHAGGTELASGITDSTGKVSLLWIGTSAIYLTITETSGRFNSYGASPTPFTCGDATTIALTAASGYHCTGVCLYPLKDTLTFTGGGGTATLQYGIETAGVWSGCYSPSDDSYTSIGAFPNCPGTSGTAGVPTQIDYAPNLHSVEATFPTAKPSVPLSAPLKVRSFDASCSGNLLVNSYSGSCPDVGEDFAGDAFTTITCPLSFEATGTLPTLASLGETYPASGPYTITE